MMTKKQAKNHRVAMSIVLNAHTEGASMQATMRSLHRSMNYAREQGISLELVVVLDKSNHETETYIESHVKQYFADMPLTVEKVAYGDLGLSRNHGVEKASGTYVGVVDADDLFAQNLIESAYRTLEGYKGEAIVHPGYVISFDHHNELWRPVDSTSSEFERAAMVAFNPWPSLSFASKKIRDKIPYKPTHIGQGFGPEDWQWNCDTLAAGIEHFTLKDGAYFYRRKAVGSLAAAHGANKALLWPNAVLGTIPDKVPSMRELGVANERAKDTKDTILAAGRRSAHIAARVTKPLFQSKLRTQRFHSKINEAFEELFSPVDTPEQPKPKLELPEWLVAEWQSMHEFDHKLFPDKTVLDTLAEYKPTEKLFTSLYWSLFKEIGKDTEYIFIVPWLNKGGADLVIINYVKAILEIKKDAKITVVATEIKESLWAEHLPKHVRFVSLDNDFYSLGFEQQTFLLGTLCIQISPKTIHLINSLIGFRLFTEYARSLSKYSHLFVSAFAVDRLESGKREHYLLDHLKYSAPYVTRVLTDNTQIAHDLIRWQAFDKSLFSTHHQPVQFKKIPKDKLRPFTLKSQDSLKVLWAGRIDRPKRPDILMKIAEETARRKLPVEFHIYGSPVLDKNDMLERFKTYSNIVYEGPFDEGLWQIPLDKFDVFLMNSEWEGLPNALLQAFAGGLPAIASAVGGIPELITEETGYLISPYDNVEAYVDTLANLVDNRRDLQIKQSHAQKVIEKQYRWQNFVETLRKEKGYID